MALRGDHPDYINAVFINVSNRITLIHVSLLGMNLFFYHCCKPSQGYKQQRAFIIAQSPMQSTARDFWKTVYDRKCGVVVMPCDLVESGKVGFGS